MHVHASQTGLPYFDVFGSSNRVEWSRAVTKTTVHVCTYVLSYCIGSNFRGTLFP